MYLLYIYILYLYYIYVKYIDRKSQKDRQCALPVITSLPLDYS